MGSRDRQRRSPTRTTGVTLATLSLVLVLATTACGPPERLTSESTDLYLVTLETDADGRVAVGEPINLTGREGYDNQPCFTRDGSAVLYSSRSGTKADIYSVGLDGSAAIKLTSTADRDYSPHPWLGGEGFTAVVMEHGRTQRLRRFDENGAVHEDLLPFLDRPLLYYAWIDPQAAAVVLESSDGVRGLYLADREAESAEHLVDFVGRTLALVPGESSISFVHKSTRADWWIRKIDLLTGEMTSVSRTLPGTEDFAWTPEGDLLMARDSELHRLPAGETERWERIADFAEQGLRRITRLAVSPDGGRLILVAEGG